MRIPLARPSIGVAEERAVIEALRSGWLSHGPANDLFEREFASFLGVEHAVAVNSCASALHAVLVAAGVTGEVLVPSFTWSATANAVLTAGATPVWVDIEPETLGMCPKDLRAKISPRSEAIITVHFAGQQSDVATLASVADEHGLLLIEDAAETVGATQHGVHAGVRGVGCFSFFPSKNMTTGEGGMVTTSDPALAERVAVLSRHGVRPDAEAPWLKHAVMPGYNFRMSGVLAALGRVQLARLPEMNAERVRLAAQLTDALTATAPILGLPRVRIGHTHVYQMYTVIVPEGVDRDEVVRELRSLGVEAAVHFSPPVHLQSFYAKRAYDGGHDLPVTVATARSILTLPLYVGMTSADVSFVAEAVGRALTKVTHG